MPPPKRNWQGKKPTRGGGHRFTNPRRLAAARNDEEEGMWGYRDQKEEVSSEEESENETPNASSSKDKGEEVQNENSSDVSPKKKKNSQGSDSDSEDDDEDDDDNLRSKVSSLNVIDIENPNRAKKDNLKASDIKDSPREMTRREREAAEKEAARQRYWKLHQEGKTEQAKADLERLAVIKKQREEAASKRKAEQEAKAEAQKAKLASQGRKIKK